MALSYVLYTSSEFFPVRREQFTTIAFSYESWWSVGVFCSCQKTANYSKQTFKSNLDLLLCRTGILISSFLFIPCYWRARYWRISFVSSGMIDWKLLDDRCCFSPTLWGVYFHTGPGKPIEVLLLLALKSSRHKLWTTFSVDVVANL